MSEERQPKYKVGDKVKLNVGGPDMAIDSLRPQRMQNHFNGTYRCQWFAGKKLESGVFPEDSLINIETEEAEEAKVPDET
jgi:uncharacterized protein YodC (DUF2158 family)